MIASINPQVEKDTPKEHEYADFSIRLGAYIIDFLGMMLGAFLIGVFLYSLFEETIVDALPDIFWGYFSYVIYSSFSLAVWSTTFGKYLYGLRVESEKGDTLDFGQALKRSFLQPISTLFFGIGYWKMSSDDKKRAWHDKVSGTVVIKEKKNLTLALIFTLIALALWMYSYSYTGDF